MSVRFVVLLLLGLLAGITNGSSVRRFTYNHHVYEVYLGKTTQSAAESQCTKADGILAYFENSQEYEYVVKKLIEIGRRTGVSSFYIGLMQDNYYQDRFSRWMNGEKVLIDYWGKGEPNSLQDWCVTIEIQDGRWHDIFCYTPKAFICKLRPKNVIKTCRAWGDPHYSTFDGATIHFYGTECKYLISEACKSNAGQNFSVIAKNEYRYGNTKVSYTRYVDVHVSNNIITLEQAKRVKVNGLDVTDNLPVTNRAGFEVWSDVRYVYVTLHDSEVRVLFDGNAELLVEAPSRSYSNKLCGICGNFDGNTDNDYTLKNGRNVRNVRPTSKRDYLIGYSWQVPDVNDPRCRMPSSPPKDTTFCEAAIQCEKLTDISGMFKVCLRDPRLDVDGLYKACTVDMCQSRASICKQLTILAQMCSDLGYFYCWRPAYNCDIGCAENSHYSCLGSPYRETCHGTLNATKFLNSGREVCQCDDGYVLDGTQCVRRSDCGCHDLSTGTNHKLDSIWIDEKCSYNVTCTADENGEKHITKRPINCHEAAECKVNQGIRGCYCKPGYHGNSFTCERLAENFTTQ